MHINVINPYKMAKFSMHHANDAYLKHYSHFLLATPRIVLSGFLSGGEGGVRPPVPTDSSKPGAVQTNKKPPEAACVSGPAGGTLFVETRSGASSLASNVTKLVSIDADIRQITFIQALERGQRRALTAPSVDTFNQSSEQHNPIPLNERAQRPLPRCRSRGDICSRLAA